MKAEMTHQRTAAFICLAVSLAGCGLKKEYRRVTDQLDTLEAGQKRTEAKVNRMDSLARAQSELLYQLNAELNLRLGRIEENLMIGAQQKEDQETRRQGLGLPLGTAKPDSSAPKPSKRQAEADPKSLYDTAYLDITRGNYDLSVTGFREFLKNYPASSLADNAQYWIGEAFYAREKFSEALTEFMKVVSDYPNQDKVPAAMYKSGLCHQKLGDKAKAAEAWKQLISKYPRSNEAALAKERLKEFEP
jgi:tol-pal system protein YbgF